MHLYAEDDDELDTCGNDHATAVQWSSAYAVACSYQLSADCARQGQKHTGIAVSVHALGGHKVSGWVLCAVD
jgi:hypothetical protein